MGLGAALRPLLGWKGLLLVSSNAAEFVLYLYAMHLISAGQVMALWKSNALWVLLLLVATSKERVRKISIASTICVLAGVIYILIPASGEPASRKAAEFLGWSTSESILGSAAALLGGLCFAVFSVTVYHYPLSGKKADLGSRLSVQAGILVSTALLILTVGSAVNGIPTFDPESALLILFNGIRIGAVYVCYTEAIKRTGKPLLVACIIALEVPTTILIEFLLLGHRADFSLVIGGVIILLGALAILQENDLLRKPHKTRAD